MKTVSISKVNLQKLIEQVGKTDKPVRITDGTRSAVLVPFDQWRGIEETMYLLSIPGMGESIIEGLNTPVSRCSKSSPF
jgi:prevent-host-death family protein